MKILVGVVTFFVLIVILIGAILRNPILSFDDAKLLDTMPSANKLREYVEEIVGIKPFRKSSNIDSLNRVADYIHGEFSKHCPQVEFQEYEVNGDSYKNVICFFPGRDKRRIVIGAHYDVCGDQDGADDNASGVAGTIELARLLKENESELIHDLEIVAYTLEEPPYFRTEAMGSYIHAKKLREGNTDVAFMTSVEMIGYFSGEDWSQDYPVSLLYAFYPIKGDFITLIGGVKEYWQTRQLKSSLTPSMDIPLYSLNAPAVIPGVDFSDHLNYWRFNYNGYMITDTSFYRNSNYHKVTDTMDKLNFKKMAAIVRGLYGLVTADYN